MLIEKPVNKPYQCNQCENRYTRQEHLDRHVAAKHAQARDFVCPTCAKSFSRKDILKRHEKTHAAKDPNVEVVSKKQTRSTNACESCAAQKLKCSGDYPCTRCAKANKDCVYTGLSQSAADFLAAGSSLRLQSPLSQNGPQLSMDYYNSPMGSGARLLPSIAPPSPPTSNNYTIDPLLFLGQTPSHMETPLDISTRLFNQQSGTEQQISDLFDPSRTAPASFLPPSFDMLESLTSDNPSVHTFYDNSFASANAPEPLPKDFSFENFRKPWINDSNSLHLSTPVDTSFDRPSIDLFTPFASTSALVSLKEGEIGLEAYNRCVRNLQDIHTVSPFRQHYFHPVDTRETFNKLIHSYFKNCSSMFPYIHEPTFDPNSCHWVLLLAIVAHGARYGSDDSGSTVHANALSEMVIRTLSYMAEQDTENLKQIWFHQATLMVVTTGLTTSEQYHYDWAQVNKHLSVTYCQRLRWLDDPHYDRQTESELPLQQRWLRWVKREGIKRLGLCIFSNEALSSLLWGTYQTELYNEVAVACLPCAEDIWAAKNENEWAALFSPQPLPPVDSRFDSIFRAATVPDKHEAALAGCRSWLGVFVLNWFSHTLIIKCKATNGTMRFILEDVGTNELFPTFATAFNIDHLVKLRNIYHFFEKVCTPREDKEREAATLARLLHLDGLCDGLPAVFLQSYARRCAQAGRLVCPSAVTEWLETQNGALARRTIYHAGQLFALKGKPLKNKHRESDVFDAYSLFYAAIAFMFYARFGKPINPAGQTEVNLAQRRSHKDPTLTLWVTEGNGVPCLPTIGQLNIKGTEDDISLRILSAVADKLSELRHVQIAGQLSQVLNHLLKIGRANQLEASSSSLFPNGT